MALKAFDGPEPLDPNLKGWWWLNTSAQTQVLVSFFKTKYPFHTEWAPKIWCYPGRATQIPHRYYRFQTRDDSPSSGREIIGEEIENYAPGSYSHGDAYGHEE